MQVTVVNTEPTKLSQELRVIPGWAIALAVVLFACMQVVFNVLVAAQKNPPPVAPRIFLGLLTGGIVAIWALLIGYVNRDAARRNMSRTLWTLVAILVPNGLGFILYFLLRQPAQEPCPRCGALVHSSFNYCPNCNMKLHPHCAQCQRPAKLTDTYCAYCGYKLEDIVHSGS